MNTIYDWVNEEDLESEELLNKLETYMKLVLLLHPETIIPTYNKQTKTVSLSTGFSFVIPIKLRT